MKENYTYPINTDWNTSEIIKVMEMWQVLELTYEKGQSVENILSVYKEFKSVVKSIGEERQLGKEYEEISGYSLYRVIQLAKKQQTGLIKPRDLNK